MLDQRDVTGRAALHHAVADPEERHQTVETLLAAKAQVNTVVNYQFRSNGCIEERTNVSYIEGVQLIA